MTMERGTRGAAREAPLIDCVSKRVRVWWPLDSKWYPGTVAHWTSSLPETVRQEAAEGVEKDRKGWYLVRAHARDPSPALARRLQPCCSRPRAPLLKMAPMRRFGEGRIPRAAWDGGACTSAPTAAFCAGPLVGAPPPGLAVPYEPARSHRSPLLFLVRTRSRASSLAGLRGAPIPRSALRGPPGAWLRAHNRDDARFPFASDRLRRWRARGERPQRPARALACRVATPALLPAA